MPNYDFCSLLSAFEFECFSRDLLNAHYGFDLSSFAEGRDGGIDLRYTSDKQETVIVQAKRYKVFSSLKSNLHKEVEKVKKLKFQRYILSTSVDLTAANKLEIMELFSPYIQSEGDILGKQDLNKRLADHPDVEQRYYKLWLASTSVLFTILKKEVINWTSFEQSEIEETVKTYVMNDSFDEALRKLIQNKYVVISGVPGIGKTTLARMLIAHLLSERFTSSSGIEHFDEFFYTDSEIGDLVGVMQEGKRQVFFFDDFMGKIAFEEGEKNFGSRITKFIKACQRYGDKLLILTTREYILQQGLVRYSQFYEGEGLELSKCVVDMGHYTRFIRAQILYNHLVANDIPQPYIDAILKDKNYFKLIDHENYSPRIIETFLGKRTHEHCRPEEYFTVINGYFDHPDEVWLDAFKRLSDVGKEALLVLSSMDGTVMLKDWKTAYEFFFSAVHKEANYLDEQLWTDTIKILQGNFIKIGRGKQGLYVDFHNPGISDVLTHYIKNNPETQKLLLNNVYFVDQIFGVFRDDRQTSRHASVSQDLYSTFVDSFGRCWGNYESCKTSHFKSDRGEEYVGRFPRSRTEALYWLKLDYEEMLSTMPGYVEGMMSQVLMEDSERESLASQISLLERADLSLVKLDLDALFDNYLERLVDSSDCLNLVSSVNRVFPSKKGYIESGDFCDLVVNCLEDELLQVGDNIYELFRTAKELCNYVPGLAEKRVITDIEEADKEYDDYIESRVADYHFEFRRSNDDGPNQDEREIDNLFSTIKSQ